MSDIRVGYSGLIAFVVGIIGVITGLVFIIIVTRRLTPEELGLWTLIGSLIAYVTIIEPIISYWTTRQIARGDKVGFTSLTTSAIFSVIGMGAYSLIAIFVASFLQTDFLPLILAITLVPLQFLNYTLNSIVLSSKPQGISYANMSFEIAKLPFGFILVYLAEMGLVGAIVATLVASIVKIAVLLFMGRSQIIGTFKKEVIKFWLRFSWIPLYSRFSGFIFTLDVFVFSMLTNSLTGLAYWGVSNAVANLTSHSGQISQALYPKLLATRKKEFAENNLKILLYFVIPFVTASIVFAKPALHILNPIYVEGFYIIYFLAIRSAVNIISSLSYQILVAYEKIDLDKGASFKQYMKSKLFFIPTLAIINFGSYLILLTLFLIISKPFELAEVQTVTIWSAILLIVAIPFMIYGLILVKREIDITLPYSHILKFSIVSITVGIISHFIIENWLVYTESIFEFLPQIIPIIIFAVAIYFGLTFVIDKSTRDLVNLVLKELGIK